MTRYAKNLGDMAPGASLASPMADILGIENRIYCYYCKPLALDVQSLYSIPNTVPPLYGGHDNECSNSLIYWVLQRYLFNSLLER